MYEILSQDHLHAYRVSRPASRIAPLADGQQITFGDQDPDFGCGAAAWHSLRISFPHSSEFHRGAQLHVGS